MIWGIKKVHPDQSDHIYSIFSRHMMGFFYFDEPHTYVTNPSFLRRQESRFVKWGVGVGDGQQ